MNTEKMKLLIPEPLREQFVAWASLKTEAEREEFNRTCKHEVEAMSEAERIQFEQAWLEGIQILKNEVRAIGEEIRAAKATV